MWLDKAATWALARGARRRGAGRADPRGQPHLLPRRPRRTGTPGAMAAATARPASCAPRAMRALPRDRADELRGQGNLPHAAGRGRPGRPAGGVLPLRRLQSVERAARRIAPTAVCTFCDTDFVGMDGAGGGRFADAAALADARRRAVAGRRSGSRFVVCTGGEPLLQLDAAADRRAARARLRRSHRDQRHARRRPPGIDWICVSPKADAPLALTRGDELKLVYPAGRASIRRGSTACDFDRFFAAADGRAATARATPRPPSPICLAHPHWRLSLQTHKILGIP